MAVIGGGPAGLAAALAAGKTGASKVLILERDHQLGGILQQCIHPGFGLHLFRRELTGPEYAEKFISQIRSPHVDSHESSVMTSGIDVFLDTMVLRLEQDRVIYAVNSVQGVFQVKAGALVLATGCRERTRGAIEIPGTRPSGVFTAGAAQRFVNIEGYMPGKEVVILGSGDVGLIMARRLTLEGAVVKAVLEIMPYPGGLSRNITQCLEDFDIPLLLSHTITKIHGAKRLQGITYAKVDDSKRPIEGTERFIKCDTLLLSVGLIPENELGREQDMLIDPVTGGPLVSSLLETSLPGVFSCGNALHVHDLVDNVTMESEVAGKAAAMYAMSFKELGITDAISTTVHTSPASASDPTGSANTTSITNTAGTNTNSGRPAFHQESLPVKAGEGIRYVVPQRIVLGSPDPIGRTKVQLFMRVTKPVTDCALVVALAEGLGRYEPNKLDRSAKSSAPDEPSNPRSLGEPDRPCDPEMREKAVLYTRIFPVCRPGEMLEIPLDLTKLTAIISKETKSARGYPKETVQNLIKNLHIRAYLKGKKTSHTPKSETASSDTAIDSRTHLLTCVVCPMGCQILIKRKTSLAMDDSSEAEDLIIEGAKCPRGKAYAKEEITAPKRTLTTTVAVNGGASSLVPVRTHMPIPKALLRACMNTLSSIQVQAPIRANQIILENILGTGANIVATGSVMERRSPAANTQDLNDSARRPVSTDRTDDKGG